MSKTVLTSFTILCLLSIVLLAGFRISVRANPNVTHVPDDYEKIQWAIGNASIGDTIYVRSGIYYEHLIVNKPLSLIGESREATVIDGNGIGTVVLVEADNVTIDGFTVQRSCNFTIALPNHHEWMEEENTPFFQMCCGIGFEGRKNLTISGNIIRNNYYGIWMGGRASNSNIIIRNYITGNCLGVSVSGYCNLISENIINGTYVGIHLGWVEENIVSRNFLTNNSHAIDVKRSTDNVITGNNITENLLGIFLSESGNNTVTSNNCTENQINFGVYGSYLSDFINEIDSSNIVNGKRVYYLINENNVTVDNSTFPDAGFVALINSTNIRVRNLELEDNYSGLLFAYTNNSVIRNVTCANNYVTGINLVHSSDCLLSGNRANDNYWDGIVLGYSSNCIVLDNEAHNNRGGISLLFSSNCSISGNNANNNTYGGFGINRSSNCTVSGNNATNNGYGIYIEKSSKTKVFHNNFINNTNPAYVTSGYTNVWDDGYPSGGNYWSDCNGTDTNEDGIGDTPYIIDENNRDNYPLIAPYIPPAQIRVLYYDLLKKFHELLSHYNLLDQTYQKLLDNITNLQGQINSLNSTFQTGQESIVGELTNIRNLMYIFIALTTILIATTAYLAIRKPKLKP